MVVSGQLHALAALSQRKSIQYPINSKMDGPPQGSGYFTEKKSVTPVMGQNLIPRSSSP